MKYSITIISLVLLLTATISILIVQTDPQSNKLLKDQTDKYKIPDWVKHNAHWWVEGHITDAEFSYSMQYLIDQNIIHECEGVECID